MNLIIDVGNTRVKFAVFLDNHLVHNYVCDTVQLESTLELIEKEYPEIKDCILAAVGTFSNNTLSALQDTYNLLVLNNTTKVPFVNDYGTPETLGVDRLALASAASAAYPGKNVLVIDAGSCITYDFISRENRYKGGAISPGIGMRYKAVHTFTAGLPLLEPTLPSTETGNTTETSIHIGVMKAVVFEIEGFISMYREKNPDLTIILTGGDVHFLRDSLKSDIFANSNFLLEGLNFILEHNKH